MIWFNTYVYITYAIGCGKDVPGIQEHRGVEARARFEKNSHISAVATSMAVLACRDRAFKAPVQYTATAFNEMCKAVISNANSKFGDTTG